MIFQTIDDKSECIGVYADGHLHYNNFPEDLSKTWKYTGSLADSDVEYAWLYTGGKTLAEVCPEDLLPRLQASQRRSRAYIRSFEIAKIDLREHCIFDLVPEDYLKDFCEIKNKITQHVFETHERPEVYEHQSEIQKLLYKISYQRLNLSVSGCKSLHYSHRNSLKVKELVNGYRHIEYNLFGTVTGRLTTTQRSFPILTVKKDFRKLLKPNNDWFLSLDYNAAEVRTFIGLADEEQPQEDVHTWHIKNLIADSISRTDAKVKFFAWLYNPDSADKEFDRYHRQKVLDKWYDGAYIKTMFKRRIPVDRRKALNYLIQSTTSDLVLERAVAIDKFLEGKKSFISHIVHDEIVVDLADSEREIAPQIREIFANNKIGNFMVNLTCGKNYLEMEELKI